MKKALLKSCLLIAFRFQFGGDKDKVLPGLQDFGYHIVELEADANSK